MNLPAPRIAIEPQHYREWYEGSGVDQDIINLNVKSFHDESIYELLLSDALGQMGGHAAAYVTAPVKKLFQTYATIANGGWWCSGLDPLNNWEPMAWGQFKPDVPRPSFDKPGKFIKYEPPAKVPTRSHFLRVSFINSYKIAENHGESAQKEWLARVEQAIVNNFYQAPTQPSNLEEVAERDFSGTQIQQRIGEILAACRKGQHGEAYRILYGLRLNESINHSDQPENAHRGGDSRPGWLIEDTGFWSWLLTTSAAATTIVEGAKKAGNLLSNGRVAIALPGIFNGYRKATKKLIDDLAVLCAKGRPIYICFDHDTKEQTRRNVNIAMSRLGKLFAMQGCEVKIIELPGPEKGVDDFVMARGREAFDSEFQNAIALHQWQTRLYSRLTYEPSLELNQENLGSFELIGEHQHLIGVNSPKGSGKTHMLKALVETAKQQGRRVLVITHRVQLGQDICHRIELPYITEAGITKEGAPYGYGLCIDSLHPESQACFDAEEWDDALIIIDEVEQVLWHLMNANTEVKQQRLPILDELQQLVFRSFRSKRGQVIAMDADLTDVSINFLMKLGEMQFSIDPFIVVNHYKPESHRTCYHYNQSSPKEWLASLIQAIAQGQKCFVTTQGQKVRSVWSATNFEQLILQLIPACKILRIDSETISDPDHPAYGVVDRLNSVLDQYDVVIATPSIETGVSIDIQDHFDSVWGCFWGVSPSNSARQALARIRADIPRHVWAVGHSNCGKIAGGATTKYALQSGQTEIAQASLQRLQQWWDNAEGYHTHEAALHAWAEMACRINTEMIHYRKFLIEGLEAEGYQIESAKFEGSEDLAFLLVEWLDAEGLERIAAASLKELRTEMIRFCSECLKGVRRTRYLKHCEAIVNCELIDDKEGEFLKIKRNKTLEERLRYSKWILHKKYGGIEVTVDLVEKDDDRWHSKLKLDYFSGKGREFADDRDSKLLNLVSRNHQLWYPVFVASQIGLKIQLLEHLRIRELMKPDEDFTNSHELIQWIEQQSRIYAQKIKQIFGVNICEKDSPIAIANKFLKLLGLKIANSKEKRGPRKGWEWLYRFIVPEDGREDVFERWFERDLLSRNESAVVSLFNINNMGVAA